MWQTRNAIANYVIGILFLYTSLIPYSHQAETSFLSAKDDKTVFKQNDEKDKSKEDKDAHAIHAEEEDKGGWNFNHISAMKHLEPQDYGCKSQLYCQGHLLAFIQHSKVFNDAKTFVDMPSKRPVKDIMRDFERSFHGHFNFNQSITIKTFEEKMNESLVSDIKAFLVRNFDPPGTEMRVVLPADWHQQPAFLSRLKDQDLLLFARAVHEKWRCLLRDFDQSFLCSGCVASSFKLPSPFIIPGGRFREFYYWDSYWILEGLYVSEMCQTARGMIENMLAIVERFGFVPNGSRVYYLNRSQPPLLALIIKSFMENCLSAKEDEVEVEKRTFLKRAFPLLQLEHGWWIKFRTHAPTGLASYQPQNQRPRPESFLDDELAHKHCTFPNIYENIAGGAESGWDFSSRWFLDYKNISSIRTGNLLAVDLNAILYHNERIMAEFARDLQLSNDQRRYEVMAEKRAQALHKTMWNGTVWLDYDYIRHTLCNDSPSLYISSLAPLWFDVPLPPQENLDHDSIVRPFLHFFEFEGGVPIGTVLSGQQWDFPNVWAPMQHLIIGTLLRQGTNRSRQLAITLAQKWINSTYCGYHKHGQIFEKYHAQLVGEPGVGGEYDVQEGFGWSNGVILWTLKELGPWLVAPKECPQYVTEESPALARLKERHELDLFVERQDSYKKLDSPMIMEPSAAKGFLVQLSDDDYSVKENEKKIITGALASMVSLGLLIITGVMAIICRRYYYADDEDIITEVDEKKTTPYPNSAGITTKKGLKSTK